MLELGARTGAGIVVGQYVEAMRVDAASVSAETVRDQRCAIQQHTACYGGCFGQYMGRKG